MKRLAFAVFALIGAITAPAQISLSMNSPAARSDRRAVEAVIWGMPVVNCDLMFREMARKVKRRLQRQISYSDRRLLDAKNDPHAHNPCLHQECRALGRSSQTPGLNRNTDGSVDIYFRPRAPPGEDANWVPDSTGWTLRSPCALLRAVEASYSTRRGGCRTSSELCYHEGWMDLDAETPAIGGAAERAAARTLHTPTSGFMDYPIAGSTKPAADQRHRLWFQRRAGRRRLDPKQAPQRARRSGAESLGVSGRHQSAMGQELCETIIG